MRILLFRGTGLVNALIRWQTRSHYAHAAIYDPATRLLWESYPRAGVRARYMAPSDFAKDVDHFVCKAGFSQGLVQWFLSEKKGRGYDYLGVLRFLTREKERDHNKYFCSELVYEAFQSAGVELLNCAEPWKISPALLALSPYLEKLDESEKSVSE